jgi:DNA-directed RNA polymerase subunit RPC12/RpoP
VGVSTCGQRVEYPSEGVGTNVACPGCGTSITLPAALSNEDFDAALKKIEDDHRQRLAEIERKAELLSANPNLRLCKTCGGVVAISAEFCVHCGQKWPTLDISCGHCGSKNIEIVTVEDNSSLFVTPSLAGAVASALFEATRPRPKVYAQCQNCGYSLELGR